MADVTPYLEAERRRFAATRTATWRKAHINAALQAIEDAMVSTSNVGNRSVRTHIGAAIETAAPQVFTAQQKDDLFIAWSGMNARRGGIL
jgi:hypothetical protein